MPAGQALDDPLLAGVKMAEGHHLSFHAFHLSSYVRSYFLLLLFICNYTPTRSKSGPGRVQIGSNRPLT